VTEINDAANARKSAAAILKVSLALAAIVATLMVAVAALQGWAMETLANIIAINLAFLAPFTLYCLKTWCGMRLLPRSRSAHGRELTR